MGPIIASTNQLAFLVSVLLGVSFAVVIQLVGSQGKRLTLWALISFVAASLVFLAALVPLVYFSVFAETASRISPQGYAVLLSTSLWLLLAGLVAFLAGVVLICEMYHRWAGIVAWLLSLAALGWIAFAIAGLGK